MNILKKAWLWLDDRTGISEFIKPLARHPVPPDARWMYVFGSATLFTFILQVITGVALAFMYQPTSESAYESLRYITYQAFLGNILRAIHFFSASAMIILVGLHMIRVFLTAAYKYPREMSWITGAFLLLFTLGMGFTGQLLRWDSNGVWSAIVGAEQAGRIPFIGSLISGLILGGQNLGGATLSRFFAVHVFLFPAFIFLLIGIHIYMVLYNGISEPPRSGRPVDTRSYRQWYQNMLREKGVPFWPDEGWRDMAFGVFVVTVILILALVFRAPEIGAPPDPSNIQSNPRPDWYFLWIFAFFALMPRVIESWAIAFLPLLVGIILIALPLVFGKGERSPVRRPWSVAIVIVMLTTVAIFWHYGQIAPWSPNFGAKPLSAQIVGNTSPDAAAGADLFYKKGCLYCHKLSGRGGIRGPDLSGVAFRLTGEQMIIRIVNGSDQMPAYASVLSNDELAKLVSFLKTRKFANGGP